MLDLKPLLVNQAARVPAGRSGTGEMSAVILGITGITTLPSVVVAWKQVSVGALICFKVAAIAISFQWQLGLGSMQWTGRYLWRPLRVIGGRSRFMGTFLLA